MPRIRYHLITSAILAVMLISCSSLPKNQALTEAEKAYFEARQDEQILRYASSDLERAENALSRAAQAKKDVDMTSLAYVGKIRTETARVIAQRKAAAAKLEELGRINDRESIRAKYPKSRPEQQTKSQSPSYKERAQLNRKNTMANAEALNKEMEKLQAMKTERGMVMTLGDVLFSSGKTNLLPGAMNTIDKLANFLAEYKEKTVLIEGHTDNVGSDAFNLQLSEKRANSVKEALIQVGVDPSRIDILGLGESSPITDNSTPAGRLKNRRVEIVIRD
jgi:OmpA-OmpF porin, OOP family